MSTNRYSREIDNINMNDLTKNKNKVKEVAIKSCEMNNKERWVIVTFLEYKRGRFNGHIT